MKLFHLIHLLMAVRASSSEFIPAKWMAQSLDTRATFYGGWPIAATSCPSNTTSCDDGSCCPSSSTCYTEGLAGVAVCCPDTNNCVDTVNTLPVCADSSWTLYIGNYYYFCCASGQVGILPDKGSSVVAGLCVDSSVSPAASVRASVYAAASPTAASSSSSPSSSTTTSSTTSPTSTHSSTAKPSTNSSPASVSVSMSVTSSLTTVTTSSTSQSTTDQPKNSTSRSTSHTGAIAGGVVAGVVGLALIILAIWFFGCRKKKDRAFIPTQTFDAAGPVTKETPGRDPEANELPGPMAGNFGYGEMAAPDEPPAKDSNFKSARMSPTELP